MKDQTSPGALSDKRELVGKARQPINLRPQVADIPRLLGRVIENVQRPEDLSVIGSEVDKVIPPDMVTVFWSQAYTNVR